MCRKGLRIKPNPTFITVEHLRDTQDREMHKRYYDFKASIGIPYHTTRGHYRNMSVPDKIALQRRMAVISR